jgi:hypothetical protein
MASLLTCWRRRQRIAELASGDPDEVAIDIASLKLGFLYRQYTSYADLVRLADAKAAAVLILPGVACADLLTRSAVFLKFPVGAVVWGRIGLISFWASLVFAILAILSAGLALFPRYRRSVGRISYFGDVASFTDANKYFQYILTLDFATLSEEVAREIWAAAQIALMKFRLTRVALLMVVAMFVMWGIARVAVGLR